MRAITLVTAAVYIAFGWGDGPIINNIALIVGGLFAGFALTDLLNDPTE